MTAAAQESLLIELGTEELPPKALKRLGQAFANGIAEGLKKSELGFSTCDWLASPRRLAVKVEKLEIQQQDQSIERRGPAVAAAFDANNNPTQAALGFAKSNGVSVEELGKIETDKGAWLSYKMNKKGLSAAAILPKLIEEALAQLPIPKRMTWGNHTAAFVRPTHWLVVLLGSEVVGCNILEQSASNKTYGHRFHANKAFTLQHANDYEKVLTESGFVMVDYRKRQAEIKKQLIVTAKKYEAELEMDQALLDEVTGLVEWPVALSGMFDESFLEVPSEALISAMKEHQKYFPLKTKTGELLNRFITIANIVSTDPEKIITGNEKVIRPRLADARYFYLTDKKQSLDAYGERLKKVVFQKDLGSVFDKSTRVSALAGIIASQLFGKASPTVANAQRASLIAKADLATEMVGEFPDLQGTMGCYYAKAQGENNEVASAIEEQYLPKSSGGELPKTETGICVALAEKLDTLVGIFGLGLKPTGDKDPFALRRAALGVINILIDKELELTLSPLIEESRKLYNMKFKNEQLSDDVAQFFLDRYRSYFQGERQKEKIETEVIMAVEALKPDSPVDFNRRLHAVKLFQSLPEAEPLAIANKRVSNILKKSKLAEDKQAIDTNLLQEPEEHALLAALSTIQPALESAAAQRNYSGVLTELSSLKDPIDAFFDKVMVNADHPEVKNNRLLILRTLHEAFMQVADISLLSRK